MNLNQVNLIGDYNIIKSIENKIKQKTILSIKDFVKKDNGKFYVNLSPIVGNGSMTVEFYDGIKRQFQNIFNLIALKNG
jgi:hypothetical protein